MTEKKESIYPNIAQSWGIVGVLILLIIVFSPVRKFLQNIAGDDIAFFMYYLLTIGTSFLYAHLRRKKHTEINKYNFNFSTPKLMLLVSITVIAILIVVAPISMIIPMPESIRKLFLENANQTGVLSFLTLVIIAPLFEEIIFRGIILDGLLKKYSPVKSIIISSMLFSIAHLNPWSFITTMSGGLFMGWIYYKTNKLILPILIHFVNNLISYSLFYILSAEKMMNDSLLEIYGGYTNIILITIGAIIVSIFCLYLLRKEFKNTNIYKL